MESNPRNALAARARLRSYLQSIAPLAVEAQHLLSSDHPLNIAAIGEKLDDIEFDLRGAQEMVEFLRKQE